jgi:hypothetical protein
MRPSFVGCSSNLTSARKSYGLGALRRSSALPAPSRPANSRPGSSCGTWKSHKPIFQRSDRVFQAGIEEADSQRELNHAELRREIVRRIEVKFSGGASRAEIKSSFKNNTKHKAAIDNALQDMLDSGMLVKVHVETGGRGKEIYQVKREG